MKVFNIKQFKGGWFVGDFEPSLQRTPHFEVAHHFYLKGYKGKTHHHKISTEYNYILRGSLIASGQLLTTGDIFVYNPEEVSDVTFLEDTDLIIVKTPSIPGDKYE